MKKLNKSKQNKVFQGQSILVLYFSHVLPFTQERCSCLTMELNTRWRRQSHLTTTVCVANPFLK